MPDTPDNVIELPRRRPPVCALCGRRVAEDEARLTVHSLPVHVGCAVRVRTTRGRLSGLPPAS